MKISPRAFRIVRPEASEGLRAHGIACGASLLDALRQLNSLSGASMTLFAINADGKLAGTLTDGDVRRALLDGCPLSAPVENAMHTEYLALAPGANPSIAMAEARRRGIRLLPLVEEGYVSDIIDLASRRAMLPIDAVLMAGGKGERLRPLTLSVPKPLLPVGGKPIIDYNVDELKANGVEEIFVTVNYLKEQLQEHFAGRRGVRCVEEPAPLGTIGSLSLVRPFLTRPDLLLMNSDILTSLSFESFYNYHKSTGADVTIAAVPYNVSVPYAILRREDDRITGLEEKPTFNYLANSGVYLIRRGLIDSIPEGERLDAPDFIQGLIENGRTVKAFPIDGTWIDIGSPADYAYADKLMSRPGK